MRVRRLSAETTAVLGLFVADAQREAFGREIIVETGIPSGSLYPILRRLEERGFLVSAWEPFAVAVQHGRRPRRTYRLDAFAADRAGAALDAARVQSPVRIAPPPNPATT